MLPFGKKAKTIDFDRTYPAPPETVWRAWTEPELLRRWWGPEKTTVPECTIDLRDGGQISVVMEAGPEMGKYAGTRWPMLGTFTRIEPTSRLSYDAESWTEGKKDDTTITHANDVTLDGTGGGTNLRLTVTITAIGPKAKMAAFGLKFGYKAQLAKLDDLIADLDAAGREPAGS